MKYKNLKRIFSRGVTMILTAEEGAQKLNRFLSGFFQHNTHYPFEVIVIDQSPGSELLEVLHPYIAKGFIAHLKLDSTIAPEAVQNYAAQRAVYPLLLFCKSSLKYKQNLLPLAVDKLEDPFIGVAGAAIEEEPTCGAASGEKKQLARGFYNALNDGFFLCRKNDFLELEGFAENLAAAEAACDFCRRMTGQLGKKIYCCGSLGLQPPQKLAGLAAPDPDSEGAANFDPAMPAATSGLRVLLVLPSSIDSNCGYHATGLLSCLQQAGVEAVIATPENYSAILRNGPPFTGGAEPDIVHAWTPREIVRRFTSKLAEKYTFSLVIHLEDNEEYLTAKTIGRPFDELLAMPEKKLDTIIPVNRYHPIKGSRWLAGARGLTMITESLQRFNPGGVPGHILLPPLDSAVFYPRPVNYKLRRQLGIPDQHLVLVYTGALHAGNLEEVRELYVAVEKLNAEGFPATLIRTGINQVQVGLDRQSLEKFEKPLGWVKREQVPEIMAAANIFVQPGRPGPFNDYRLPCKIPEYFALKRPVVLPKTNLGLQLKHGREAYILNEADASAIAAAVMELAINKDLSEELAAGAYNYYRHKMDRPQQLAQKLLCFYRQSML